MEIRTFILLALSIFALANCTSQDNTILNETISHKKLKCEFINNNEFYLETPILVNFKVVIDSKLEKTLLITNNDSIKLDFYFTQLYFNGAYWVEQGINNFLILENNIPGASGLSANILEVSVITFTNNEITNVFYFNSFYAGVELLKINEAGVTVSILDFSSKDTKTGNDIYCVTEFVLKDKTLKLALENIQMCYIATENGIKEYNNNCRCIKLSTPYVLR